MTPSEWMGAQPVGMIDAERYCDAMDDGECRMWLAPPPDFTFAIEQGGLGFDLHDARAGLDLFGLEKVEETKECARNHPLGYTLVEDTGTGVLAWCVDRVREDTYTDVMIWIVTVRPVYKGR